MKYLLEGIGFGLLMGCVVAHVRRACGHGEAVGLALCSLMPLLAGISIVVIPPGSAGVRTSRISGRIPGTLYPGAHLLLPLVEDVVLYDIREQVFATPTVRIRYRVDPRLGMPPRPDQVPGIVAAAVRESVSERDVTRRLARQGIAVKRVDYLAMSFGVAR